MFLHNKKYIPLLLLLSSPFFLNCEKIPTSSEQKNLSNISVLVQDEFGTPLKGVQVRTFPGTVQQITNKSGQTEISDIPEGNYQVVISRADIPIFYREVRLRKNKPQNLTFIIATKITITVAVTDIYGRPIQNIEVSTSPHTSKVLTDTVGLAVLENVPVRRYTFIVTRNNAMVYIPNKSLIIRNGVLQDIKIEIDSQPPFVKITEPKNNNYEDIFDIHLTAEGFDFEDGALQFDAFTWYSDIDGELGTGKELTVDRLSIGHHIITLAGTDIDQKVTERFIKLNLYYFEEGSYFPLPWGGYWNYRYHTPEFSITDRNVTENWILSDLKVSMEDINTRNCLLEYTIESENRTKHCLYYVVDYFETDVDNIYVAKTIENLKIWHGRNTDDKPSSEMNIETVYSPRYLFIKNHMDLLGQDSFESTVTADIFWNFEDVYYGSKTFRETMEVYTFVDIGDIESIETEQGTFDTTTLEVFQGETSRKWWLAKGIGMVQLDYNTIESHQIATLYDTNIYDYNEILQFKKPSAYSLGPQRHHIMKVLDYPLDTPEGNLELCKFLRSFCPR